MAASAKELFRKLRYTNEQRANLCFTELEKELQKHFPDSLLDVGYTTILGEHVLFVHRFNQQGKQVGNASFGWNSDTETVIYHWGSRDFARALGKETYVGTLCKRRHNWLGRDLSVRYTTNRRCVECWKKRRHLVDLAGAPHVQLEAIAEDVIQWGENDGGRHAREWERCLYRAIDITSAAMKRYGVLAEDLLRRVAKQFNRDSAHPPAKENDASA